MEMAFLRKLGIVAMFLAAVFVGSKGQQTICNMPIAGLMACQPAVTGSNPPKPTDACCSALAQANLTCLCGLKSSLPGYGIDPKQAMKLPAKCKLTPPKKC